MRNLRQEACAIILKIKAHQNEILKPAINECIFAPWLNEVIQEYNMTKEETAVIEELGWKAVQNFYYSKQYKGAS